MSFKREELEKWARGFIDVKFKGNSSAAFKHLRRHHSLFFNSLKLDFPDLYAKLFPHGTRDQGRSEVDRKTTPTIQDIVWMLLKGGSKMSGKSLYRAILKDYPIFTHAGVQIGISNLINKRGFLHIDSVCGDDVFGIHLSKECKKPDCKPTITRLRKTSNPLGDKSVTSLNAYCLSHGVKAIFNEPVVDKDGARCTIHVVLATGIVLNTECLSNKPGNARHASARLMCRKLSPEATEALRADLWTLAQCYVRREEVNFLKEPGEFHDGIEAVILTVAQLVNRSNLEAFLKDVEKKIQIPVMCHLESLLKQAVHSPLALDTGSPASL